MSGLPNLFEMTHSRTSRCILWLLWVATLAAPFLGSKLPDGRYWFALLLVSGLTNLVLMAKILRPGMWKKELSRTTWLEKLGFGVKLMTYLFLILGLCLLMAAWCLRGLLFYRG